MEGKKHVAKGVYWSKILKAASCTYLPCHNFYPTGSVSILSYSLQHWCIFEHFPLHRSFSHPVPVFPAAWPIYSCPLTISWINPSPAIYFYIHFQKILWTLLQSHLCYDSHRTMNHGQPSACYFSTHLHSQSILFDGNFFGAETVQSSDTYMDSTVVIRALWISTL